MGGAIDGCYYYDSVGHMLCTRDHVTKNEVQVALENQDRIPFAATPYKDHPELEKASRYLVYKGTIFTPSCSVSTLAGYPSRHIGLFTEDPVGFINDMLRVCPAK